ncbi:MAG TPA: L-fucokinase, partial [Thermoguttaceae bacterium]
MNAQRHPWDYLIVTASNDSQALAYQSQLELRQKCGLLGEVRQAIVVVDPQGKRIGSGGSTIYCLMEVLRRELKKQSTPAIDWTLFENILRGLRILIIHAGGDSKRLPAYGPCGKLFIPVPGESRMNVCMTIFDHLWRTFSPFPATAEGCGQVVVAAGDALIRFDASKVKLASQGIMALGCYATAEEASKHGVFCASGSGPVRLFLQKPSPAQQAQSGALNSQGQSILDMAVMSLDAAAAAMLLKAFEIAFDDQCNLNWSPIMHETIITRGLDLYREISCALGSQATAEHLVRSAKASGSTWDEATLQGVFEKLNSIPFFVEVLSQCSFLHFGTTCQLVESGLELTRQLTGACFPEKPISMNNVIFPGGELSGPRSWVEGCRLSAAVNLKGNNVVIGVDVDEPFALPDGACLDVLSGHNRNGESVWFVRCYHVKDTFKDSIEKGATFCGRSLLHWLSTVGATADNIWNPTLPEKTRSLWDARVFPALKNHSDYRNWLWMYEPDKATEA